MKTINFSFMLSLILKKIDILYNNRVVRILCSYYGNCNGIEIAISGIDQEINQGEWLAHVGLSRVIHLS